MKQSENLIQSTCFLWHWNTFIDERGLLCYNLNNSANKIQGNQNRSLGLIKGRADMTYYHKTGAIFLEFKTDTGSQMLEQKKFQDLVEKNGYRYLIVRSFDQFQKIIYETQNRTPNP